jgi:AraC-like DNA-binding protein
VNIWKVSWDSKGLYATHQIAGGLGHSLLTLTTSHVFRRLRISASLYSGTDAWWSIHSEPNLTVFEYEHGVESLRWAYNDRHTRAAAEQRKMIVGRHAGYCDLFVPIVISGQVAAVLVTGPFAIARPTSTNVIERWKRVRGRHGRPSDPEFFAYLKATLSTLVLDGSKLRTFQHLLDCLSRLIAGEGPADELATRAYAMTVELARARLVDRTWEEVRKMVDRRSSQARFSGARAFELRGLGLRRPAEDVLVGLGIGPKKESNAVDHLIRHDAFQRAAVELASAHGDVIAGQVGDQGVVFLSSMGGAQSRKRRRLLSLAERASNVARKSFGLDLHFGLCLGSHATSLSHSYQLALSAAESALARGKGPIFASPEDSRPLHPLRALRDELSRVVEEHPDTLRARFEQYVDAVARRYDHRPDSARAELELCFDRAAGALSKGGVIDRKSLTTMRDDLDRAASEARTLSELFGAYRRAIADLSDSMARPVAARQDRSLRSALEHIAQHFAEPLSLAKVARVAGFSPKYFSKIFHRQERTTFERYVLDVRLERARHLLAGTDLHVARIAELSGFRSPQNLCRVFRQAVGATPLEYRREQTPVGLRNEGRRRARS